MLESTLPQARLDQAEYCPDELFEAGRILFEHEYTFADGLGSGLRRGDRPSPFRRVHSGRFGGPETISCTSCHWRGGLAGAGALQDNTFVLGTGDRVEEADARNPPPLHGVGVVELIAKEMTAQLHALRDDAIRRAREDQRSAEVVLLANGVSFGKLRVAADGTVDTSQVEGVDPDLVIKPFGWKGTVATLRDFVAESAQVHFGMQSQHLLLTHGSERDLVGTSPDARDPDGDGVVDELTEGHLSALVSFLAMLELPVIRPHETLFLEPVAPGLPPPPAFVYDEHWARGQELFRSLGCASCHVPAMVLKDPVYRTTSVQTGGTVEIDLSTTGESPRPAYDAALGGYPVWVFSDFKRHDMGAKNEARRVDKGVAPREYLTRRLWGVANSDPYFHDGAAPWFDHAIAAHGGEASEERDSFEGLSIEDRGALKVYLLSLRRDRRLLVP
ncbi:MAG: di-heme oxidoredictase family protein [Myxococcota bacterium]